MNKYDLIAFDMDGTLVKSSGLSDCNGTCERGCKSDCCRS
ncbi:HAD family hydrolase [Dorea sp. AM58-8]|nr:HAD family hydrolase [Dorea sp. AM58-8]